MRGACTRPRKARSRAGLGSSQALVWRHHPWQVALVEAGGTAAECTYRLRDSWMASWGAMIRRKLRSGLWKGALDVCVGGR